MRLRTTYLWACLAACAVVVLAAGRPVLAQTFVFDVIDDTFISNNGGNGDAEDSFGGRTEVIGNNNGASSPREMVFRFDVAGAAAAINDPGLIVVEAALTLNPRDERLSNNEGAPDAVFGIYGIVSQNEGWVEGTQAGSGAGLSGELGSASRLYLANPSSATTAGGPADDGLQWFSAGGGATSETVPTQFDITTDTSNIILGSASTSGVDTTGGDADWSINLDGPLLNPFVEEWLAAPSMGDGDGGTQTSNAGLVVQHESGGNGQWFFESNEGRSEQAAKLTLTFGPAPILGDVNDDTLVNSVDFETIRQNFWQEFSERNDGDLVNNDFIDFADYGQWKQATPKDADPGSLAAGSAVPEPASVLLLIAATLAGFGFLRR